MSSSIESITDSSYICEEEEDDEEESTATTEPYSQDESSSESITPLCTQRGREGYYYYVADLDMFIRFKHKPPSLPSSYVPMSKWHVWHWDKWVDCKIELSDTTK